MFTICGIALILQVLTSSTIHYKSEPLLKSKSLCAYYMRVASNSVRNFIESHPQDTKEDTINSAGVKAVMIQCIGCPETPGEYHKIIPIRSFPLVFDISCPIHGDLSRQTDEHKFKGIEETLTLAYKIKRFFILTRYEPQIWVGGIFLSMCLYAVSACFQSE